MTLNWLDYTLVAGLAVSALATVMTTRLMWSVLGLAVTSAVLTAIMFRLNSPLAAVFELSVCAGLIPAIFISTIGLTVQLTPEGVVERQKQRLKKLWFLPILMILAGVTLIRMQAPLDFAAPGAPAMTDVRDVLWHARHIDLVGQVVVLLGAAFAVVVLLKELKHD